MTLVNIDLRNVAGETGRHDQVVFHAPVHREGSAGQTIQTAPVMVDLEGGIGSVDLDPGPVVVEIRARGWEDTAPKTVMVPEEGPITLTGLLLDAFEWAPVVVSEVRALASRAESAADRAENVADTFGSLEGVAVSVQAAQDAATSATGSASAAASSATAANDSQVSAASSATAAAQSAVNAANSEWVAGEHKGSAESAAASAASSADDAAASAVAAASSASEIAGQVSAAQDAAESASGSATAASEAADTATSEADRSSSEADRAEAAAQSAQTGVQPDTVGRVHLTPELRGEIDGKAAVSHVHTIGQVSGLQDELDAKATSGHSHTVASINGLQTALDGKAAVSHDHTIAQVTGLEDALATAGGPPVIVSTTPPEDTDAIWVNPDEVPPPTGGGTAEQDTGWRNIAGTVKLWPTDTWDSTKDTLWIRRVGSTVHLMHKRSTDITANSWGVGDNIPAGFRPAVDTGLIVHGRDNNTGGYLLRSAGQTVWTGPLISSAYFMAPMQGWLTTDPWPTTLPGTAVEGV